MRQETNWITGFILALGAGIVTTSANAMPMPPEFSDGSTFVYCDDPDFATIVGDASECDNGDVNFRQGGVGPYSDADNSALFADNNDSVDQLSGVFPPDSEPWQLLDKTDAGSSALAGVEFTLTATGVDSSSSGTWVLTWSQTGDPGLPITMDVVFVTKSSDRWAGYLFEGYTFASDPSSGDGTFGINYLNNGGQIPNLSHGSIYGRLADDPDNPDPPDVPVPGTVLLMGLGLGLLRFAKVQPS